MGRVLPLMLRPWCVGLAGRNTNLAWDHRNRAVFPLCYLQIGVDAVLSEGGGGLDSVFGEIGVERGGLNLGGGL